MRARDEGGWHKNPFLIFLGSNGSGTCATHPFCLSPPSQNLLIPTFPQNFCSGLGENLQNTTDLARRWQIGNQANWESWPGILVEFFTTLRQQLLSIF